MSKSIKELFESVDIAHKGWDVAVGLVTVASPFLIPSKKLAMFMAAGALAGGLLGYYFCVSNWAGKGRELCLNHRKTYWTAIPLAMVPAVILYSLLQPTVAKWTVSLEQINNVLLDVVPVVNGFLGFFTGMISYALVGAITISSPKLWVAKP